MILSSVSVLQKNPHPDEVEIRHGLQGNICRCGTYPRIVAAVRMAAHAMSAKNARGGRHA
jgi:aerobic-type carbon monoxide dehydrogenase small subunit (CoxS/CutS family)